MSHDRDHDHRAPAPKPRPSPLASKPKPDHKRLEQHPTGVPLEPVDPRAHPGRG